MKRSDKRGRGFFLPFCILFIALHNTACLSQRKISNNAPSAKSQILLQRSRGLSFNGLVIGQSMSEIHFLLQDRNLELIVDSEIGRIRNPKTGNFVMSMTISNGCVTGFYSDKESGLFVNQNFVFAEDSPALLMKAFDPQLNQLNGQHVFDKAGTRLEVFCNADKVEDFRLIEIPSSGNKVRP